MLYVDPYRCYFEQRYDGVLCILPLWGECPALDLDHVENYDPADYDTLDIEAIIRRYYELSLEPGKQQIYAGDQVRRLRKAMPNKKHVMRYALQLLKVEAARAE